MKRYKFLSGLFIAFTLIWAPVSTGADTVDLFTLQDAVDVLITAASSQSADPGMATALSAVPAATRAIITFNSQAKMVAITEAIAEYPDREKELLELQDRYQAIQSAIHGKPGRWNQILKMEKEKEKKRKAEAKRKKPTEKDITDKEEKENAYDLISRYRKKINGIKGEYKDAFRRRALAQNEFYALISKIKEDLLRICVDYFQEMEDFNSDEKRNPCFTIKEIEKKTKSYAILILDTEKKYKSQIHLAQKRLAACKGPGDVSLIKSSYAEAKRLVAQIEKDFQQVASLLDERNRLHREYDRLKTEFNTKARQVKEDSNQTLNQEIIQTRQLYKRIKDISESFVQPKEQLISDKKKILNSSLYYGPKYPDTKKDWGSLLTLASSAIIEFKDGTDYAAETLAHDKFEQKLRDAKKQVQQHPDTPLSDCNKDLLADKAKKEAEAIRDHTAFDLAANKHIPDLADACMTKKGQGPSKPAKPGPGKTDSGATPPPTPQKPPKNSVKKNSNPYSGGLFITGKARLRSGEGANYIAKDGAGNIYTSGVSWMASVENVFVMGGEGSGVAFKPGNCTIIAHKDDMTAYFDIQVLSKVPNVSGLSPQIALGRLRDFGLQGKIPKNLDKKKKYKVTGQSQAPETHIEAGTVVLLNVQAVLDSDKTGEGKKGQVAGLDCSKWSGSQAVWDEKKNRAVCKCVGNLVPNKNKTKCVDRKTALLETANCGFYPNTRPVWDDVADRIKCDCLPGYVWSQDKTACLNPQQAALETIDCSYLPGSEPEWDYFSEKAVCRCKFPYMLDGTTGKCIDPVASANSQADQYEKERIERDKAFQRQLEEDRRRYEEEYGANIKTMADIMAAAGQTPQGFPEKEPAHGNQYPSVSSGGGQSYSRCPEKNPGTKHNNVFPPDHKGTYIFCRYYPNGQLAQEVPWKSGKRDGWDIGYFSNGLLKSKTLNRNGRLEGPYVIYGMKNGIHYKAREGRHENNHLVKGAEKRYPAPK